MSASEHAETLLQAVRCLYQQQLLTDLTLITEKPRRKEIRVHKAVLFAFSKHFQKLTEEGIVDLDATNLEIKGI